jgi:hypothetical protein
MKKLFIREIQSFNEINFDNYFNKETDLVLFDIDNTIIFSKNNGYEKYILSNEDKCNNKVSELKNLYADHIDQNKFLGYVFKNLEYKLVDQNIIKIIKDLKEKKVLIIGITALLTGFNDGIENSWQNWRFNHLKNLGIEFSFSNIEFEIDKYLNQRPIFYKGIIFTDYLDKGESLKLFLREFNKRNIINDRGQLTPKRIIMFDDSLEYLENVMKVCQEIDYIDEFHGYHFKNVVIHDWDESHQESFNKILKDFKKKYYNF